MSDAPAVFLRSSEIARRSGVSTDTLRHYEARGLLPKARRSPNGYREYPEATPDRVRLVRRAVALGFTLDEVARILALRDRGGAPCRTVRALAAEKLARLEERLQEVTTARNLLRGVLETWDVRLAAAPAGARLGLLEALDGVVVPGQPSPLLPAALGRTGRGRLPPSS
jgi:DNA-binding transcriptional MerR regulator